MASGDSILTFVPACVELPASNAPQLAFRNAHPVLAFDAATQESAFCTGVLRPYAGGGLTARIYWSAASATSGDVVWAIAIERIEDEGTDVDADSFASDVTATATAPGTSGAVQYTEIAITDGAAMDSVALGELFRLRLRRVAADGADTMAGDAEVHCVEVRES